MFDLYEIVCIQKILDNHLHQSPKCLEAMTSVGTLPSIRTLERTLVGAKQTPPLSDALYSSLPNVDVVQHQVPMNAYGDVVLDHHDSSSSNDFQFSELEDFDPLGRL